MENTKFAKLQNVAITCHRKPSDKAWNKDMVSYHVTLTYNGRTFETSFSMGCGRLVYKKTGNPAPSNLFYIPEGLGGKVCYKEWVGKFIYTRNYHDNFYTPVIPEIPKVEDVLYSLQADTRSIEGYDYWGDWAEDMGMSEDSISARDTYVLIQKNTRDLKRLLGKDYDEIMELARQWGDGE